MKRFLLCVAAAYCLFGSIMCAHVTSQCGAPKYEEFDDAGVGHQ